MAKFIQIVPPITGAPIWLNVDRIEYIRAGEARSGMPAFTIIGMFDSADDDTYHALGPPQKIIDAINGDS